MKGGRRTAQVTLACLFAVTLTAQAQAGADERVDWHDLRPAPTVERNPFEALTDEQVDWISEIARGRMIQARGQVVADEDAARHDRLTAALAAQGWSAEELLRQREALIEQRRAAAESPVPAVAGREARLLGHLVPASADGSTVTDFLFVPWANSCSHARPPANQTVRIPAGDLSAVQYAPSQPLVLTGRVEIQVQVSKLRFVDGMAELQSTYVVNRPSIQPLPTFTSMTPFGAPSLSGGDTDGGVRRR